MRVRGCLAQASSPRPLILIGTAGASQLASEAVSSQRERTGVPGPAAGVPSPAGLRTSRSLGLSPRTNTPPPSASIKRFRQESGGVGDDSAVEYGGARPGDEPWEGTHIGDAAGRSGSGRFPDVPLAGPLVDCTSQRHMKSLPLALSPGLGVRDDCRPPLPAQRSGGSSRLAPSKRISSPLPDSGATAVDVASLVGATGKPVGMRRPLLLARGLAGSVAGRASSGTSSSSSLAVRDATTGTSSREGDERSLRAAF